MKSAMKKLLSLMLVAMLLVSAIPFAASAEETAEVTYTIRYAITVDGGKRQTNDVGTVTAAAGADVATVLNNNTPANTKVAAQWGYSSDDYTISAVTAKVVERENRLVYEVSLTSKSTAEEPTETTTPADDDDDDDDTTITIPADSTKKTDKVSKDSYYVYLYIYTGNDISSPVKKVDITEGYAVDNKVSWSEVEQYVKNNFSASNSLGITIDGIYVYEGSWAANWLNSEYKETDVVIPDDEYRTGNIYLMVMLTGKSGGTVSTSSSSSSSSSSTSSNPKTGDTIGTTFLALGVSASALAAAYFVEKKRLAR